MQMVLLLSHASDARLMQRLWSCPKDRKRGIMQTSSTGTMKMSAHCMTCWHLAPVLSYSPVSLVPCSERCASSKTAVAGMKMQSIHLRMSRLCGTLRKGFPLSLTETRNLSCGVECAVSASTAHTLLV